MKPVRWCIHCRIFPAESKQSAQRVLALLKGRRVPPRTRSAIMALTAEHVGAALMQACHSCAVTKGNLRATVAAGSAVQR